MSARSAVGQASEALAWIDKLQPPDLHHGLEVEAWLYVVDEAVVGVGASAEQARARGLRRELEGWLAEREVQDEPALAWVATAAAHATLIRLRATVEHLVAILGPFGDGQVVLDVAELAAGRTG